MQIFSFLPLIENERTEILILYNALCQKIKSPATQTVYFV